jgi:hypothetical protein
MLRLIILAASISAFGTAGYSYWMAVRLTRDPDAAERIVTWGGSAPRSAYTSETTHYRARMRWGSRIGIVLFGLWAYLTAAG